MIDSLHHVTQTFLIPISILFAGFCLSNTTSLRAFLSVVGLAFTLALIFCLKEVPIEVSGAPILGLLSIFLGIVWVTAILWQTGSCLRHMRRRGTKEPTA